MTEQPAPIHEAAALVRRIWDRRPRAGIILGTGLSGFAEHLEIEQAIACERLPNFPRSTADGHVGRLLCGELAGVPLVVISGRCHAYEGYSEAEITMPVRLMHALGIELLILTNASGGMNSRFCSGDVMIIEDHINFMGRHAQPRSYIGAPASKGKRCYSPRLIESGLRIAGRAGFAAHPGIYAAMIGPNYETRAEYRFLRSIGADAVGMSTVPEALVAAQYDLPLLALSTITNICSPDRLAPARHEDVIAAASRAEPKVRRIIADLIEEEFPEQNTVRDRCALIELGESK